MQFDSTEKPTDCRLRDLTRMVFDRWTVLSYAGRKGETKYWNCKCSCGTQRPVVGSALGRISFSCGCRKRENLLKALTTHGKAGTREYQIWSAMKRRCYNKATRDYPDYGGRGITVCARWKNDFAAFLDDMGARPTKRHMIERKDNSKGYGPDNCIWDIPLNQANNKRNNHFITIDGAVKTVTQWARVYGIDSRVAFSRISQGWDERLAVCTPLKFLRK